MKNTTFFLLTLGCPKNEADSDRISSHLIHWGYRSVSDPERASFLMVNTCAFIQAAVEESIEAILDLVEVKREGKARRLIVLGCLPQRYGEELVSLIPEVDAFVGQDNYDKLPLLMEAGLQAAKEPEGNPMPRNVYKGIERGRVYIKVADGCNHRCSFCTIPKIKGPLISRCLEEIVTEAEEALARGAKELVLVAQDTTSYGRDLEEQVSISSLLEKLISLQGDFWIRLMYVQPDGIDDRLLELLTEEKICSYLDIPLQHVDTSLLRKMGREGGERTFHHMVERIRRRVSGIALRSTFIVGFPGENEVTFKKLYNFVETVCFDWLALFRYSHEEGTRAFGYGMGVPRSKAEGWLAVLRELQEEIMARKAKELVGSARKVLVEGPSDMVPGFYEARSYREAPEIDGLIFIPERDIERAADFYTVKFVGSEGIDLIARTVKGGESEQTG
jgi:ribosomal protein S12 methylthiotransferase